MTNLEKVFNFLEEAKTYFIATVENDQPRVRPFGTILCDGKSLYIQTGKNKEVAKQIFNNSKVEICACKGAEWVRIACTLKEADKRELRVAMLEKMPSLRAMYNEDDNNTEIFYFKSGIAIFSSFTKPKEEFEI
jgi:uncharacterized pyridoxamine 5'-phosphate oxidase family protein